MWGKTKKHAVLKTGQTYKFHITLRREAPTDHSERRCRVRPWTHVPVKLEAHIAYCDVEASAQPVNQADGLITWEIQLRPKQPGWTTLFLFCRTARGDLFAEQQLTFQIDGEPQPVRQTRPVAPPGTTERHVVVEMPDPVPGGHFTIDGQSYPYPPGCLSKQDFWGLRRAIIQKLAGLLTGGILPPGIADILNAKLPALFGMVWWQNVPVEAHLSLIHAHYGLPFEFAQAHHKPWGVVYGIGHLKRAPQGLPAGRPAKLVVIADLASAPVRDLIGDLRTAFPGLVDGAGEIRDIPPDQFTADQFKLKDMITRAQANVVYLAARALPDADGIRAEGLEFHLSKKHAMCLKLSDAVASSPIFPHDAVVFLAPSGDADLETAPLAYRMMEMGARAVIAPICTLPESVGRAVAIKTLALIRTHGGSLNLGRAMAQLRVVFPPAFAFALFGDPRTQLRL